MRSFRKTLDIAKVSSTVRVDTVTSEDSKMAQSFKFTERKESRFCGLPSILAQWYTRIISQFACLVGFVRVSSQPAFKLTGTTEYTVRNQQGKQIPGTLNIRPCAPSSSVLQRFSCGEICGSITLWSFSSALWLRNTFWPLRVTVTVKLNIALWILLKDYQDDSLYFFLCRFHDSCALLQSHLRGQILGEFYPTLKEN